MSSLNRRALLLGSTGLVSVAALAACGAAGATLSATILSDSGLVVSGLETAATDATAIDPALFPAARTATLTNAAGTGWLDIASAALSGLTSATPVATGATTLQTIEGFINKGLVFLAPVTQALAATNPAFAVAAGLVDAASVLAPGIETYLATILPTVAAGPRPLATLASARAPHVMGADGLPRPMTPADARSILAAARPAGARTRRPT